VEAASSTHRDDQRYRRKSISTVDTESTTATTVAATAAVADGSTAPPPVAEATTVSAGSSALRAVSTAHGGRVWDVSASRDGHWAATASADGHVRLFDLRGLDEFDPDSAPAVRSSVPVVSSTAKFSLSVDTSAGGAPGSRTDRGPSDLYSLAFHPGGRHIIAGGFDRRVQVLPSWSTVHSQIDLLMFAQSDN
jgi:WD40 repeat protein